MQQLATYGLAIAIVAIVAWIAIKAAIKEAREAGAASVKAKASEEARKAEQEMADEIVTPTTNQEAKDRFRKGDV